MTYLVTAYRWGWTNAHQYIVYCGPDADRADELAERECAERGGKYGVIVQEWDGEDGRADAYYPSSYGELAPYHNYRIDYIETLGHMMEDYVGGTLMISVPHSDFDSVLKRVEIEPDPRLVERAESRKKFYDALQRGRK